MAWTLLKTLQSGLQSCTNCAYFTLLWKQAKVFKKKEDLPVKQGHKLHLFLFIYIHF